MASRIRMLPPELIDQIAAGEVVERPASVVKELVENALDSGAHKVDISIDGGGLVRIRVADDGGGMTPEEAHLALKRHATSKLAALDDLFRLVTMGFRGEALPSIASVSTLTLTTRTADRDAAYRLSVDGGVAGAAGEVGAPVGTEVVVERLFDAVPARKKFLKAESTESAHVSETVMRLALAHPQIHFRLRSQNRVVFDLPPHLGGLERARVALSRGSRTPVELHLAVGEEHGVHVEAYLASPAEATGTSRNTYPFVNRRFVRDRGLLQAILMGYGELLERGRYPLAVAHVAVPGEGVDVNVHPQKLEVRFARPQEVYAAVRHTLARAVAEAPWLSEPAGAAMTVYSLPPLRAFAAGDARAGYTQQRQRAAEALRLFAPPPSLPGLSPPPSRPDVARFLAHMPAASDGPRLSVPPLPAGLPPLPFAVGHPETTAEPVDEQGFFSSLTYLGQLDRTYLVCEAAGELVLVDQHAAHERVAFQRLKDAHARRAVPSQRLLLPQPVQLDERSQAVAREQQELLASLGFEVDVSVEPSQGPTPLTHEGGVALRGVPESLGRANPAGVLREVLSELADGDATTAVQERLDHILATVACHSVVRAGDTLGAEEVRALFASMDGVDYRAHCPHGRPVLLRISLGELERRFGRS